MISPINVVSAFRSGTNLLIVGGFNMNFIKLSNYGLMYGQYYFKQWIDFQNYSYIINK